MTDALGAEKFIFDDENIQQAAIDFSALYRFSVDPEVGGIYQYTTPSYPSLTHEGAYMGGDFSESIFGKVYFEPREIKAGLIIDTTEHEIDIWNSNWDHEALVSQVQIINNAGIIHNHPSVPFYIPRGGDAKYLLQVLKDGPPIQSSQVIYTIDAFTFDIQITGQRVLAFNYACDWRESPKIKYAFNTIVWRNEYFTEQRRPLREKPIRLMSASFHAKGQDAQKFLNELRSLSKKIIGVPIYTEPMHPTTNLQGLTVLPVTESLANYWNLNNNTTMVLIRSKSNQYQSELKSIVSVGVNSVTIDIAVVGSYPATDSIIYPVLIAVIDSKSVTEETAMLVLANIDFREMRPDGG